MKPLPYTNAVTAYGLLNAVIRVTLEDYRRIVMGIVCIRGRYLEKEYRYSFYYHRPPCGAIGCIAGWTLILTNNTDLDELNMGVTYFARRLLGLSPNQEEELFYPHDLIHSRTSQTKEHAIAVIKHIRAFQKKYKEQLKATKLGEIDATKI